MNASLALEPILDRPSVATGQMLLPHARWCGVGSMKRFHCFSDVLEWEAPILQLNLGLSVPFSP